jgi:glycosyltransferase involved in cell wall biosynthesis
MKPLVSVIVPSYNRAQFIEECLESVFNQNYRPIELIVVDDGSTDNTVKLINHFKEAHESTNFIIKIIEQSNSGAPRARNKGIKNSTGEYIQFLDSDDLLLPHKIKSQIEEFKSDIHVVYSKAQFFHNLPTNLLNKYWGRKPENDSTDYFEFPWQTMCALYSKNILDRFGYWNEGYCFSQDWEFALRYKILSNVHFLDEVSSLYRDHDNHRVGNNLSVKKIVSLSQVLLQTYKLSLEHKLIDYYLVKRYRSRLLYCLIQLGAMGEFGEKKKLMKLIFDLNLESRMMRLIAFCDIIFLHNILLKLFVFLKK